jgi:ABC-type nitrate/sulfonate/bicarbonate transport system permease component
MFAVILLTSILSLLLVGLVSLLEKTAMPWRTSGDAQS